MHGFQVIFMTEQDRRIEGKPAVEWLLKAAKQLGCSGATTFSATESFGRDGRRHSAHFIELADQPVQVMMVLTDAQSAALFEKIGQVKTRLFYTKAAVEYCAVGSEAESA
jgi:PII-like signaling protein